MEPTTNARARVPAHATASTGMAHTKYQACTDGPSRARTNSAPPSPTSPRTGVRQRSTAAIANPMACPSWRTASSVVCLSTPSGTNSHRTSRATVVVVDSSVVTEEPAVRPLVQPHDRPVTTCRTCITANATASSASTRAARTHHAAGRPSYLQPRYTIATSAGTFTAPPTATRPAPSAAPAAPGHTAAAARPSIMNPAISASLCAPPMRCTIVSGPATARTSASTPGRPERRASATTPTPISATPASIHNRRPITVRVTSCEVASTVSSAAAVDPGP